MESLKGRHALVTGGNRGIGAAIAAAGATVSIVGRDERSLKAQVEEGPAHAGRSADVADPGSLASAIDSLAQVSGPIDILVNNAGGAFGAPFGKTSAEDFRRMIDPDFMGVVHGIHAVMPDMVVRGTAASGVTVNCVRPGFTDTDLIANSVDLIIQKTGRAAAEVRAALARANPQGRLIEPQEVAAAMVWFCSSQAAAITGIALPVAGGEI